MKAKARKASTRRTTVEEEMTHLGVIVNILKQTDPAAQRRIITYLDERFTNGSCRY